MATTKEFLGYVSEQLSLAEEIAVRPMMGEYLLYGKGKLIGGIYDDRLLLKPTQAVASLLPQAELQTPYEGAKPMIFVEELENRELLKRLCERTADELPSKKKRR